MLQTLSYFSQESSKVVKTVSFQFIFLSQVRCCFRLGRKRPTPFGSCGRRSGDIQCDSQNQHDHTPLQETQPLKLCDDYGAYGGGGDDGGGGGDGGGGAAAAAPDYDLPVVAEHADGSRSDVVAFRRGTPEQSVVVARNRAGQMPLKTVFADGCQLRVVAIGRHVVAVGVNDAIAADIKAVHPNRYVANVEEGPRNSLVARYYDQSLSPIVVIRPNNTTSQVYFTPQLGVRRRVVVDI